MWQLKRAYDCPRNFWFIWNRYRRDPTPEMRERWDRGLTSEEMELRAIGGFSQCKIELELPRFILQGHLDGLTLEVATFVGHEFKGYECKSKQAYEQDRFQTEGYLYILRHKMPTADTMMRLHYKNKWFNIGTYNETRMEEIIKTIEEIIDSPSHTMPQVSREQVRKSYLCSSAKCDWKPICKEIDKPKRKYKK